MYLSQYDINERRLYVLSLMLFIPILIDFTATLLGGPNSTVTMLIYGLSFIYFVGYSVRKFTINNLLILIIFYSTCIINTILFNDTTQYMTDLAFLLVCFYYFPLSALIIYNITNWTRFFSIIRPIAIISIICGLYIGYIQGINLFSEDGLFSYMEFSYALAPMIIALYINARQNKRILDLIFSFLGFATILIYGARAALGFMFIFIALYELLIRKINIWTRIIIIIIALLLYLNLENIATMLSSYDLFANSRTILRFLNNELLETDGREDIYMSCQQRINTMGLEISGLFGDRKYCDGIYPHNFIYEILMSYGIILGNLILVAMLALISSNMLKRKNNINTLTLFFTTTLFARFFISGSYLIEGKFWIFLFALLSIARYQPKHNEPQGIK